MKLSFTLLSMREAGGGGVRQCAKQPPPLTVVGQRAVRTVALVVAACSAMHCAGCMLPGARRELHAHAPSHSCTSCVARCVCTVGRTVSPCFRNAQRVSLL